MGGDLDGDGDLDVAVADAEKGLVSVHENVGDGTFPLWPAVYELGGDPTWIATGDLDGDGDLDLALAREEGMDVLVLLNDGAGLFAAPNPYALDGLCGRVVTADLDGDGDLDLLAQSGASIAVLLNGGQAEFAAPVYCTFDASVDSFAAGDVDDDGDIDVFVADSSLAVFFLLRNVGAGDLVKEDTGELSSQSAYFCGSELEVALGDLDGDGVIDAILLEWYWYLHGTRQYLHVAPGQGDGRFAAPARVDGAVDFSGWGTREIVLLDADNDGDLDIAAGRFVTRNNGSFSFESLESPWGFWPQWAGDFDDDGDVDVAAKQSTAGVYWNEPGPASASDCNSNGVPDECDADCNANGIADECEVADGITPDCNSNGVPDECDLVGRWLLEEGDSIDVGADPRDLATGDFDADGDLDIAVSIRLANSVYVLLNDGQGDFALSADLATQEHPRGLVAGDLDGDGDTDIVAANEDAASVSVFINQGDGSFADASNVATPAQPAALGLGDLDGDGRVDVAGVSDNQSAENVWILWNEGGGTFSPPQATFLPREPHGIAAVDFNADGRVDLAVVMRDNGDVAIMLNAGGRQFNQAVSYHAGDAPESLAVADMDGDGDPDVVTAHRLAYGVVTVLVNDGSGGFDQMWQAATEPWPRYATAGDMDGDGRADVVTVHSDAISNDPRHNRIAVQWNEGDGRLSEAAAFRPYDAPLLVVAGEFDADSTPDLAVLYAEPPRVAIVISRLLPPVSVDANGDGVPDECAGDDGLPSPCPATAGAMMAMLAMGLFLTRRRSS